MRAVTMTLILGSALAQGCATTTYHSRMWADSRGAPGWQRPGHVEWIRETVKETQGNPGAGAAAGAVVGGLLGGAMTGRGVGALIGAVGGAAVGAGESSGHSEAVAYNLMVRFDDGNSRVFRYRGLPPFQPGQAVVLTASGLFSAAATGAAPSHAAASTAPTAPPASATPTTPEPSTAPPPPPATIPPATDAPVVQQSGSSEGEWVGTQQYGWVWMPYASSYVYMDDVSGPLAYVYYPAMGWTWVAAPWIWGWGPEPWFGVRGGVSFGWYGHGGRGGGHHSLHSGGRR